MTAATAFAAGIAARHRVRRVAMPARPLAFARLRLPPATRRPPTTPSVVPRAAELRLVLAPRLTVSVTNQAAAPAVHSVPAAPRLVDARIASHQIERLVERAHTLEVRRETVPAPPAAAFGHRPQTPSAPRPVAPAPLVLARTPEPAPAPAAVAAPPLAPVAPGALAMPAPFEIERLTDRVMASMDRRIMAARERRGHV
jgi:hypothetical protein